MMGKDVEEGEISDTASIEEISEEDFNIKQEDVVRVDTETKPVKFGGGDAAARVWTMQDLCDKYPNFYRGYGPRLHNFAWAQAVQNKPLNEIFVMEGEQHGAPKRSPPASSVASVNSGAAEGKYDKKEVEEVVIDDSGNEKEEGELEEGEIELDTESKDKVSEQEFFRTKLVNVDSIQEALESVVNAVDGDESFEGVCLKLENALRSLQEVMIGSNVLTKDALIQRAFSAVQSVYCVYCSMNHTMKEQSKEILSRLLYLINSQEPFFASQQIKEVDDMVASLGTRASDKEKDMVASLANVGKDSNLVAKNVANLSLKNVVPLFGDYLKQDKPLEASRPGASSYRSRVLLPLLDPHKVHDVDSLPSPTRETTPSIPVHRPLLVGSDTVKSGPIAAKLAHNTEVHKSPHYSTDALRAFSSYQQKFGRNSVFMNNELPSPTPSEESGDGGGDTGGEISSAPIFDSLKRAIAPTLGKQPVSSQPMDMSQPMDISSGQVLTTTNNSAPGCYDFNPVVKPNPVVKKSVKSRDPRLLFVSSNTLDLSHQSASMVHNDTKLEPFDKVMNSRKQKTVEEQVLDGPAPKRQRNGSENSVDTDMVQPQIMNRNQLVDSTVCNPRTFDTGSTCLIANGIPSVSMSINEPVPVTIPSTMAALPAFLKGIAENPTKFLDMIKMGQQQKVAAEAQPKSNDTLMNTIHPPIPNSIPPINVTSSIPSGILPKPTDQSAKVRMKPRDPRRVLHGNALQRSGSLGTELKTDGPSNSCTQGSKENFNFQKQLSPPEAKPVLSQSVQQPDIIQQFTKNLKDIADFISVSQPLTSEPMVSQSPPIQQGQAKLGAELKAVASNDDDKRTETSVGPEAGPLGARPQNTWGDVEHLFEGYDNQQKAAIQRERARRLEEQKKMFSARKLCLVLDLDHTLLNSAKFHEVDPLHDEILRKKEEQDREKPLRHLFRFPHMGMWTKLRPGIWNFLERASKLFELHLYTMGNKLYATEMAKVLDPKGVLFAGRVISRGDDGDPLDGDERIPKSKDLEGVLGMESAVVIIDDSVRVWPHNKLNLIVVERYTYFPCSRRQFGLLGPSLLEIDHDERPEDGTLASSLGVIERMHSIFFSHQSLDDVDVRNILAAEQRKILAGCRIIFSRVFPVGEANPHLHPLWQTAEQFGAVCTKHIDDQVTHVVANSLGTDKVNWALSRGRFVVHPGWVEASALLYRRANEQDFAIKP